MCKWSAKMKHFLCFLSLFSSNFFALNLRYIFWVWTINWEIINSKEEWRRLWRGLRAECETKASEKMRNITSVAITSLINVAVIADTYITKCKTREHRLFRTLVVSLRHSLANKSWINSLNKLNSCVSYKYIHRIWASIGLHFICPTQLASHSALGLCALCAPDLWDKQLCAIPVVRSSANWMNPGVTSHEFYG